METDIKTPGGFTNREFEINQKAYYPLPSVKLAEIMLIGPP